MESPNRQAAALAKLVKAVRLHARATALAIEAAEELLQSGEAEGPPVRVDRARLRRALKRAGARIP